MGVRHLIRRLFFDLTRISIHSSWLEIGVRHLRIRFVIDLTRVSIISSSIKLRSLVNSLLLSSSSKVCRLTCVGDLLLFMRVKAKDSTYAEDERFVITVFTHEWLVITLIVDKSCVKQVGSTKDRIRNLVRFRNLRIINLLKLGLFHLLSSFKVNLL